MTFSMLVFSIKILYPSRKNENNVAKISDTIKYQRELSYFVVNVT